MWRELGESLRHADLVVLTDVYGAGERPIPGVTGKLLVDALVEAAPGKRVDYEVEIRLDRNVPLVDGEVEEIGVRRIDDGVRDVDRQRVRPLPRIGRDEPEERVGRVQGGRPRGGLVGGRPRGRSGVLRRGRIRGRLRRGVGQRLVAGIGLGRSLCVLRVRLGLSGVGLGLVGRGVRGRGVRVGLGRGGTPVEDRGGSVGRGDANDKRLASAVQEEVLYGVAHRALPIEPTEGPLIIGEAVDGHRIVDGPTRGAADEGRDRRADACDRSDTTRNLFDVDARIRDLCWHRCGSFRSVGAPDASRATRHDGVETLVTP
jgi:hypothetical protein